MGDVTVAQTGTTETPGDAHPALKHASVDLISVKCCQNRTRKGLHSDVKTGITLNYVNLRLKRRTQQLDDSKPVVLAGSGDNVIHTTRGELAMSGDDKTRLTHNLRAQKRATLVAQLVEKVHAQWATFLEGTIIRLAPYKVLEAYVNHGNESLIWQEWLKRLNVRTVQDGLTLKVYINGTEQGSARANVTPAFESGVLTMLKMEQDMVDRRPQ